MHSKGQKGFENSPGFAWHTLASVKTLGYCRAFYVLECREMWISEYIRTTTQKPKFNFLDKTKIVNITPGVK